MPELNASELNASEPNALGAKHTCTECNSRFFDLNKKTIVCPKCSKVHIPIVKIYGRKRRAGTRADNENLVMRQIGTLESGKIDPREGEEEQNENSPRDADNGAEE